MHERCIQAKQKLPDQGVTVFQVQVFLDNR